MTRSDSRAALSDEVARFQAEIRRLAFAAVRASLQQELDRKLAKPRPKPAQRRASKPVRSNATAAPAATAREQPPEPPAIVPAPVEAREQPPDPPTGKRKRVPWTRETITSELASLMLSGTAIDATFLTRHGPRGLVAATRRIFGRFEAAMNVAALHVSKLYPDGPPKRSLS